MSVSRRMMIKHAAALTAGFGGLRTLVTRLEASPDERSVASFGLGPLRTDPRRVFDLPADFSYQIISRTGDAMDDGLLVPALHDGMASFPGPDGLTLLVRNHEIGPGMNYPNAFGADRAGLTKIDAADLYDPGVDGAAPGPGGTTTLVYDTRTQTLERHYLSLAGTSLNCAGGPTPWGSWITCEETESRAGVGGQVKDHGYNFEVPATADIRRAAPVPLKAMGRFKHEAVAVDPHTGIVYQTEDQHEGLIYRFIPETPGELAKGGRLQALAIRGVPGCDTRRWENPDPRITVGAVHETTWIDLEDVEAPANDLRFRGHRAGAARFARGEGMWYDDGVVYFACTNGGEAKRGQIWKYTPSRAAGGVDEVSTGGRIELFQESKQDDLLRNADNMTMAPWGDLVIAEDGTGRDQLVGVTPDGRMYVIAANSLNGSELAGVTFSPDGSTLFVNVQIPGYTVAITGPWERAARG